MSSGYIIFVRLQIKYCAFAVDDFLAFAQNVSMNTLKNALDRRGLTVKAAAKMGKISYCTLYQQYIGRRKVGPRCAVLYEQKLGIPCSELRPDYWPPADAHLQTEAEGNG